MDDDSINQDWEMTNKVEAATINEELSAAKKKKNFGRGGNQPGAGRPKGSTNKITAKDLLESIHAVIGKPFELLIAEGYAESIRDGDKTSRVAYEKMFMNKLVQDQVEIVTINNSNDGFTGFTITPMKSSDE